MMKNVRYYRRASVAHAIQHHTPRSGSKAYDIRTPRRVREGLTHQDSFDDVLCVALKELVPRFVKGDDKCHADKDRSAEAGECALPHRRLQLGPVDLLEESQQDRYDHDSLRAALHMGIVQTHSGLSAR